MKFEYSKSGAEILKEQLEMNNYNEVPEVVEEALFNTGHSLKYIRKIRKEKPDEYTSNADLKKFIDKYGDDLEKAAEAVEENSDKAMKNYLLSCIPLIPAMILMFTPAFPVAFVLEVLTVVGWIVYAALYSQDINKMKDLNKIRDALSKQRKSKKWPESVDKKMASIIDKIDNASASYEQRTRKVE